MPLHFYKASKPGRCLQCSRGFEQWQHVGAVLLTACPKCGQPIKREEVNAVNTPKILKPPSLSDAKKAGFNVLKKTSGGELEKL